MKSLYRTLVALTCCLPMAAAPAFDPLTLLIGKGVATALDARSMDEVQADVEIDAAITKRLAEARGDDFKDVSVLVFARHAVLVGFARTHEIRRRAEALARTQKKLRSLKNDIVIGQAGGNLGADLVLDKKIDLALTATPGVSSVNMRWKVFGGDVFLMGVAKSRAEIDLARRTVRGLDGVKTVRVSLRVGKK